MFTIHKTAFAFVRQNPVFLATLALVILGAQLILAPFGIGASGVLVLWVYAFYVLFRAIMFDELAFWATARTQTRPSGLAGFLIAALLLLIGSITFGVFVFSMILGSILDGYPGPQSAPGVAALLLFLGSFGLLSLFGTGLPAAAAADRWGPSISLQRAPRTLWPIFTGLVAGPSIFGAVAMGLVLTAESGARIIGFNTSALGIFHPVQLLIAFVINLGTLLYLLLTAVALTRAYQRVAPIEVKAAMGILEDKAEVFA